jgi:hypothetical protein
MPDKSDADSETEKVKAEIEDRDLKLDRLNH